MTNHSHPEERAPTGGLTGIFARGLGWASMGIGIVECFAPKQVQRLLGVDDNSERRGILQTLGVRELAHGVSILTEQQPTDAMKSSLEARVAGDVLDTVLLGLVAMRTKHPLRFAAAVAAVVGIGILDFWIARRMNRTPTEP